MKTKNSQHLETTESHLSIMDVTDYELTIDYSVSIEEMVKTGLYDENNSNSWLFHPTPDTLQDCWFMLDYFWLSAKLEQGTSIDSLLCPFTQRFFSAEEKHLVIPCSRSVPEKIKGDKKLATKIISFNREISSANAIKEIVKFNLRPANFPELLKFGQTYPFLQKQYFIVALGQIFENPEFDECPRFYLSPYLYHSENDKDVRTVDLVPFDVVFCGTVRFLAVKE